MSDFDPYDPDTWSMKKLKEYADEHGLLDQVDARKKSELRRVVGEYYRHLWDLETKAPDNTMVELPPPVDSAVPQEYKDAVVKEYKGSAIDAQASGSLTATISGRAVATVSPGVDALGKLKLSEREPLTVDDLVFDDDKVRVHVNAFPQTVDGVRECRIVIAKVPGESDALAAAWWKMSQHGPVLVEGPIRLNGSHIYDPESKTTAFWTEGNVEHVFSKTAGCGCGNRLKNWKPWATNVRVVQMKAL